MHSNELLKKKSKSNLQWQKKNLSNDIVLFRSHLEADVAAWDPEQDDPVGSWEICQKLNTTGFSGQKFYTLKTR